MVMKRFTLLQIPSADDDDDDVTLTPLLSISLQRGAKHCHRCFVALPVH